MSLRHWRGGGRTRLAHRSHVQASANPAQPGDVGGDAVPLVPKKKRMDWNVGPCYELSHHAAIEVQLQALRDNDTPYIDHGIEVLYRFGDINPFARSSYFGRSLDLGQWERFRRIMHSTYYRTLLHHTSLEMLSGLEVSEHVWKQRVRVVDVSGTYQHTYVFTMTRHLGGRFDGYWFTQSLLCDGVDMRTVRLPP